MPRLIWSPAALRDVERLALALERHLGKREILELYLRLAPYGANVEGIRGSGLDFSDQADP